MLIRFNKTILILALSTLIPWIASASEVTGSFEYMDLSTGIIVIDGERIRANMEATRITHQGENIGEEGLESGNKVTLIFKEDLKSKGLPELTHIMLIGSERPGGDS